MNIAILSRSEALYSTQSLVTAATKRGHQVQVIDYTTCSLAIQQNQPRIYYQGFLLRPPDAIIPRIGASHTTYGASVIEHFKAVGTYTVLSSEALLNARDKFRSLQILSAARIPMPDTVLHTSALNPAWSIHQASGPPAVIKLRTGTHGAGVILAEEQNTAEATLEAFSKLKQHTLVQQYIKESRGSDLRAIVVGGQVIAAMKRRAKPGEFRANLHRGGTSFAIKLTEVETQLAIQAAQILGLQVAGIDLLETTKGPLLLEANPSPGLEGIETTTRVNVAGQIIQYIEQQLIPNK